MSLISYSGVTPGRDHFTARRGMTTASNDPLKIKIYLPSCPRFPLFLSPFLLFFAFHRLPCVFYPFLLACPDCCSFDQPSPASPLLSLFLTLSVHPLFRFPVSRPGFTPLHQQASFSLSFSLCFAVCLSSSLPLSHYLRRHLDRSGDIHTSAAVLKYCDRCVQARACVRECKE